MKPHWLFILAIVSCVDEPKPPRPINPDEERAHEILAELAERHEATIRNLSDPRPVDWTPKQFQHGGNSIGPVPSRDDTEEHDRERDTGIPPATHESFEIDHGGTRTNMVGRSKPITRRFDAERLAEKCASYPTQWAREKCLSR